MSGVALQWVGTVQVGRPTGSSSLAAKALLRLMGDAANDHGVLWGGQRWMADQLECNVDTVTGAVSHLVQRGLVARVRLSRNLTLYVLAPSGGRGQMLPALACARRGGQLATALDAGGWEGSTPTRPDPGCPSEPDTRCPSEWDTPPVERCPSQSDTVSQPVGHPCPSEWDTTHLEPPLPDTHTARGSDQLEHADPGQREAIGVLVDLAEVKTPGVQVDQARALAVCREHPDIDLVDQARRLRTWHLAGQGQRAPLPDPVEAWARWLRHATPPPQSSPGPARGPRPGTNARPRSAQHSVTYRPPPPVPDDLADAWARILATAEGGRHEQLLRSCSPQEITPDGVARVAATHHAAGFVRQRLRGLLAQALANETGQPVHEVIVEGPTSQPTQQRVARNATAG